MKACTEQKNDFPQTRGSPTVECSVISSLGLHWQVILQGCLTKKLKSLTRCPIILPTLPSFPFLVLVLTGGWLPLWGLKGCTVLATSPSTEGRETSIQKSSQSPQPSGLGDSTSEPIPMARGMTGMAWLRPGLSINKPTTVVRGTVVRGLPCGKGDWG